MTRCIAYAYPLWFATRPVRIFATDGARVIRGSIPKKVSLKLIHTALVNENVGSLCGIRLDDETGCAACLQKIDKGQRISADEMVGPHSGSY